MLAAKKISLGSLNDKIAVPTSVVKHEDRDIVSSYENYILKKTIEADTIIDEAHQMSKSIARQTREEAEIEFWKYAQAFYDELQAMRATIIEEVEQQCRNVVIACLTSVLGDVPDEEKIRPMIKELLAENINEDVATIYVHPDQLEFVTPMLEAMSVPVKGDERLDRDSVVLKTDKSQYKSSFAGKLSLLLRALESL